MELLNTSPFEVGWLEWEPNPGRHTLTVVVRATYSVGDGDALELAAEQPVVSGPVHYEDDVGQSLRWPSDLWPLKPCAEVLVVGSAHLPAPAASSMAAFTVGSLSKSVLLHGDREGRAAGVGPAEPFEVMPLRWERSFGGAGHDDNPIGTGLARERSGARTLPNIEDPARPLGASGDRPRPASLAPIPITWPSRMRHAGTYDAAWLETRYPRFAEDLDYRLFLSAPEDQRVEGFFAGDEPIELLHLHPRVARLRTALPGDTPVAFLVREDARVDCGLRLDTIVIDGDEGTVTCVWRGVTEARLEEVDELFVLAATTSDDFDARLSEARAAKEEAQAEGEPEPVPPLASDAPGARWAHLDQAMTVRGDDSALAASLQEELAKRQAEERGRVYKPVFDDALGLPARPDPEAELSPEEQLELEMLAALGDMPASEDTGRRLEVRDAVGRNESCEGWDLEGVDLSGLELSDAVFRGANLRGANLSGAHLRGADFEGAVLAEAEVSHAVFESTSFVDAELSPLRAERARFSQCRFDGAIATETYLRGARLVGCSFSFTELGRSDASEAHFEGCALGDVDLEGALLHDARFVRSSLVDAWMSGAMAERAVFDDCDASLVRLDEATLVGASFKRAKLHGARFANANLRGADLALAAAERADFSGAQLAQARLMGCVLRKARFDGAVLVQASLMKADLFQARLEGANLKHADLRGASLFQAELFEATLDDARLDLAFLHGTRIA